jgi:hypothetical protein
MNQITEQNILRLPVWNTVIKAYKLAWLNKKEYLKIFLAMARTWNHSSSIVQPCNNTSNVFTRRIHWPHAAIILPGYSRTKIAADAD